MTKNYFKQLTLLLMLLFFSFSQGQSLIHYWNFNNNTSVATITTPTTTNVSGASLNTIISGISAIDAAGGTGQNFNLLNLNAQNADASGTHLRFNDPIGSALVFTLPTTGYENAIVKFATRRSAQGAGTQVWSYSTDGTNYTFFSNVTPNNGDPALATLDFSSLPATDNNPNFKLKVEFQQAPGGTGGNNRFDNFTVQGTTFVGGGDTTAPTVAFLPLNGTINVIATTNPTIAFNESVRLFDNSAITNTNVDTVVELRLNNASGALVPFDATFSSNTITINPTLDLANNQLYYLALLPNTIEDTSNNSITTTSSASFTTSNPSTSSIDLSTYVRVGRYDLPEPTRTAHPVNNLLCQEASAVAYNWDTDTLFITADGSTSVTQVSKTGVLIDTMTMAQGGSPQGTEFYDTEGITYIGNGQFVMSEERDRQLVKFTYAAGTTLTRANTQTVKIGTFVPNTGTEGLCYDPLTGGYIVLKEISPIGIFQTNIDFAAGTATNGSATTENSINLFDPALLGFTDVADVFVLANLPTQSTSSNLLVLGQENAQVVNIDRNGNIASTLTIVSDPGNPLNAASQQHEGITMDNSGNIYIVNENGGGDINYPQLWVYAPSNGINLAPTAITLTNTVPAIIENSTTTPAVRVADILLTDDGLGTNSYSLSGADAASFQITGSSLFINPGTVLDFETKSTYNVTVNVDDTTVGSTPDASVNFVLSVTDLVDETPQLPQVTISEVAPWGSGNSPAAADWFEVTNNGTTALNIAGWKVDDSSNSFAASLALTGITNIAPGESVIFLESSASNPAATVVANFKSLWFGANPPASLQVGTYQGSGIGLSTGGDAINLYDEGGILQANVTFGASPTTLFKTFNNAFGLNNTSISLLSEIGVNDAFAAVNDALEIGSPGSVGRLFISEVAPWSSGNSPVGSDWFELTNTKAVAVNITGWKMDDNSQAPLGAVALNGITSINPGESVIFIETNDLPGKTTAFLNNWFGTNPSGSLRIGNYTGSGVGLGTAGDQVNLYNSSNVLQTSVLFGTSPTTAPYTTFDNKAGFNSLVTPITQFSAVSVNGAFIAANSTTEIGSPGTIITAPCPTITATATPALSTVCFGATTTVTVTATGGTLPYTVTGSPLTVSGGTFTYTTTDAKGCTATTTATVTVTPQPLWYLDADADGFGNPSITTTACFAPVGYVSNNSDCDDSNAAVRPNAIEVCYNGIDDDCNGQLSEGCSVPTINMTSTSAILTSFSNAVSARPYSLSPYTNLKYRFIITKIQVGQPNEVQEVTLPTRFVTIPQAMRSFTATYTIRAAAVINDEVLAYLGNTMTVTPPPVALITLSSFSCGATLGSLNAPISANSGLNATGYIFRIRKATGTSAVTGPFFTSSSSTRFVGANTFTGLPLEYSGAYKVSVAYTYLDPSDNSTLTTAYGAECDLFTLTIPTINLVAPTCGTVQSPAAVSSMTATVSAAGAVGATGYQFRIRQTGSGTYFTTGILPSRFTQLSLFGTTLAFSTNYSISVQYYSPINGVSTPSGYGSECHITTPAHPTTQLVQTQCGNDYTLAQQLNIVAYPGFPRYRVRLTQPDLEDVLVVATKDFDYSYFKLSDFPEAQVGQTYFIEVAIRINGVFGVYGNSCEINAVAPIVPRIIAPKFIATAYPNPFADNFMLDVKTTSQSLVNIKVYDMIGRLIEQRDVRTSDLETTTIGNNYPSGVYNVVVAQEDNIETVRVVKR